MEWRSYTQRSVRERAISDAQGPRIRTGIGFGTEDAQTPPIPPAASEPGGECEPPPFIDQMLTDAEAELATMAQRYEAEDAAAVGNVVVQLQSWDAVRTYETEPRAPRVSRLQHYGGLALIGLVEYSLLRVVFENYEAERTAMSEIVIWGGPAGLVAILYLAARITATAMQRRHTVTVWLSCVFAGAMILGVSAWRSLTEQSLSYVDALLQDWGLSVEWYVWAVIFAVISGAMFYVAAMLTAYSDTPDEERARSGFHERERLARQIIQSSHARNTAYQNAQRQATRLIGDAAGFAAQYEADNHQAWLGGDRELYPAWEVRELQLPDALAADDPVPLTEALADDPMASALYRRYLMQEGETDLPPIAPGSEDDERTVEPVSAGPEPTSDPDLPTSETPAEPPTQTQPQPPVPTTSPVPSPVVEPPHVPSPVSDLL